MNRLVTAGIVTIVLVGCNSILNNERGELVVEGETTNDPTTPSTSSSSGGTSNNPDPGTPSQPISGDAGQPTAPDGGQCATGQMLCNNACVSITDPLYGCGNPACTPCALGHASSACQGRTCVVATCDPGFADCDKNPANGCEVDLSKPASCGACNAVCPATSPICAPMGQSFTCTTGCMPNAPLLCGAECVDPASSENHCGGCNNACPAVANATSECTGGQCTFTCSPGFNKCNGGCTVASDPNACGPTCAVCNAPANGAPTCANNACAFSCNPGFNACNGGCTAANDPNACGPTCAVCTAPANAAPVCASNACTFQCNAGFADCNMNAVDGCEAVLASDAANCGVCGRACPAGSTCQAGACTEPVDAGP